MEVPIKLKVHFPSPKVEYEIPSYFKRLEVYIKELKLTNQRFIDRMHVMKRKIIEREREFAGQEYEKKVFSLKNISGGATDFELNLYFKTYFFIFRQATDSVMTIIYLLRDRLQTKKGEYQIINGAKPGRFIKFMVHLFNEKYNNFDSQLMDYLKQEAELLIIPRIIRNQIKMLGTIPAVIINDEIFRFYIPISKFLVKKDKTFPLISLIDISKISDKGNLIIIPEYLSVCIKFMENLVNNLNHKYQTLPNK